MAKEWYKEDQRVRQKGSPGLLAPLWLCPSSSALKVTGMRQPDGDQPKDRQPGGLRRSQQSNALQAQ